MYIGCPLYRDYTINFFDFAVVNYQVILEVRTMKHVQNIKLIYLYKY